MTSIGHDNRYSMDHLSASSMTPNSVPVLSGTIYHTEKHKVDSSH